MQRAGESPVPKSAGPAANLPQAGPQPSDELLSEKQVFRVLNEDER